MKVYIVIPALFLVGLFSLAYFSDYSAQEKVTIGNTELKVTLANSDRERMTGLSGREGLGEDEGMLFIFENPDFYGIWMKEMKFPIDIAWLDENKKIIYIEKEVKPETYPKVFNPNSRAQFVLEVNAGFFEKNKIKVGDSLETKAY